MSKLSGGGTTMNKNVRVGIKAGPPRTNIVSPKSADQLGQATSFKKDKLPIGTASQAPLGNQLVTNVGAGGPGTGRKILPAGTQSKTPEVKPLPLGRWGVDK